MTNTDESRVKEVGAAEFKRMLQEGDIRAASLDDVNGTHHQRELFRHPNTGDYYVRLGWTRY